MSKEGVFFIAQGVFSIKYPHFKNKIHPDKIIFTPLQAEKTRTFAIVKQTLSQRRYNTTKNKLLKFQDYG